MRALLSRWSVVSLFLLPLLAVACGGAPAGEKAVETRGPTATSTPTATSGSSVKTPTPTPARGAASPTATSGSSVKTPTPTPAREAAPSTRLAGSADKLLREPLAKAVGVSLRLQSDVFSAGETLVALGYQLAADPPAGRDIAGELQRALESLGAKVNMSLATAEGVTVYFQGLVVDGRTIAAGTAGVDLIINRTLVVQLTF